MVATGPLSATFPNLVKTSRYATGSEIQLNFPEYFYQAILKMLAVNVDKANFTCTTSLLKQMLTTKLYFDVLKSSTNLI